MLAKIGFILAVLIFGALMFVAGTMAPASIQSTVSSKANAVISQLPLDTLLGNGTAMDAADTSAKMDTKQAKPIKYSALDVPAVLPEKGSYALELDMTLGRSSVNEWLTTLKQQKYVAHDISVEGPGGGVWTVIAAGNYPSPADAKDQRLNLRQDIPKTGKSELRVILLPPPAPAKPEAAKKDKPAGKTTS